MSLALHFVQGSFLPLTENWIYALITHMKRWEAVVYCSRRENALLFPVARARTFDWDNYAPASLLNRTFAKLGAAPPAMAAAMTEDRPDLIHAHFGPAGWAALPLKRRFGIPLVTTFYGYDLTQLPQSEPAWRERYRRLFAEGDLFLVEGGHMRKRLVALGCPEAKAAVQHIGIDASEIASRPRERDASGQIRVLAAATFTEKKGLPYAVEAVGLAQRALPGRDFRLTIIGDARSSASELEEKRRILAAIAASGLGAKVSLLGFRPQAELREQFYKHHLFLSPSVVARDGNSEGGAPVGIIEAAATGMPVVATTHCDIPEVVVDGAGGFLAPERDAKALAGKLEFLAANDARWPEFGRAARAHVEAEYDSSKLAPRLEEVYDRLIG